MPVSPNSLMAVINQNKSKRMLASKIIETNPRVVPVLPKLVRDTNLQSDIERDNITINRTILEDMYNRIKAVKNNNKNIIKLFPDIELSIQILVSSILSPKKMTDIQLNYKLGPKVTVNPTVIGPALEDVKTYINEQYELEDKLAEIVREALFNTGAYVFAVIPEASVDEIINTDILPSYSMEDFKAKVDRLVDTLVRPVNILSPQAFGQPTKTYDFTKDKATNDTFASYLASESMLMVTDNVGILRFDAIREKISSGLIRNTFRTGQAIAAESLDKVKYLDIFRDKRAMMGNGNVAFVKTKEETKRKSLGKPMTTKIPTESIIPVFIPGNETEHIGYFVLLDETGKPLNTDIKENSLNSLNAMLQQSSQSQLTPTQKAYNSLVSDSTANFNINELFDLYKDVLEKQLYMSIKSNLYGGNAEISNKNDIYFLMFTRALGDQRTNLLYIPKELIVYFAFQYNDVGIGKSLLENLSVLSSLRAILLFAKVMAYAKQSIDVTKVNISLDPSDPDPEKTIEQVQDAVLKLRQNYFPLGINNPVDLVNWIQRAGLQFSYENNPLIPDVKIDFENANIQHTIPSSELEEDLRKQTILALGLSPETIDSGFSPEFATTVVNNNLLLSKRVAIYQKALQKHLNKLAQLLIYSDEDLRNKLRTFITNNLVKMEESLTEEEKQLLAKDKSKFIEYYVDLIADNVEIELPKPDNTNITNLAADYDIYKENLEKVIDTVISTDIFAEDITGELNAHIDTIKNLYKNHLLRKWCANNNFFPEVLEMVGENDEETENLIEEITGYLTGTMRNSAKLLKIMQDFKKAANSDIKEVTGEAGSDSGGGSSSYDSGGNEGGGDDSGGGGGDDLGGFGDLVGDDAGASGDDMLKL